MRCPSLVELPPPPADTSGWPWTVESEQLVQTPGDIERWPRISVVTPSFNQGEYIEQTIRSVLLQGYPDLEYIIMDGGSTDGSAEIIRRYEPWLSYWVSEPDDGQTAAINQGWKRATGEVLAYLNTDDVYLPATLAAVAREFIAAKRAGMIYGSATVVDDAGRRLRTWQARPFSLKAMLTEGNVVPQPAAFFSRFALEDVGFLSEGWQMIMDYELTLRVGLRYPSVCLSSTLAEFRDHPQSKSRLFFSAMAGELIRLVDELASDPTTANDVQPIRPQTLSRIHYESALAYVAHNGFDGRAAGHLRESLRLDARYALGRPIQTAYLFKELLLRRRSLRSRAGDGE